MNIKRTLAGLLACTLAVFALGAHAQQPYPAKPIKFVVPFASGGSSDALARTVAHKLGEALGGTVIVDNRPGAAGIIGTELVAKSPPDGYTLMFTIGAPIIMNPLTYSRLPYDAEKDFIPIAQISLVPSFLVVTPGFPAKTIQEFMAVAKSGSKQITYGSFGTGTGGHVAGEYFNKLYGTKLVHVPYKGISQAVLDVVTGQIDAVFIDLTTAGPLIKSGKLRALAAVGTARMPGLPDVPTFAEAGYPGLEKMRKGWYGLLAPAGTPKAIVDRLAAETVKIAKSADLLAKLAEWGLEPTALGPAEFAEAIKLDRSVNKKILDDIGGIRMD